MSSFRRSFDGIVETTVRCEGPQGSLHTRCYRPQGPASGQPIVIAPPDAEERDWALRPLVTAARSFAARGYPVLRLDYYGQGESDGNYEETTIATRVADLLAGYHLLREQTGRTPVVLGARLGAPIALLAAEQEPRIRRVVLWEPVVDADAYLQQLLRVNVSTQMVTHGRVLKERPELIADARAGRPVSVNGYQLSGVFIDALLAFDVQATLQRFDGEVLAVTLGPLDPRVASAPGVSAVRVRAAALWKEPKIHTVETTPFLEPTVEWLVDRANQLRDVS